MSFSSPPRTGQLEKQLAREATKERDEARRRNLQQDRNRRGRFAGTLLTGTGLQGDPNVGQSTLLGGGA